MTSGRPLDRKRDCRKKVPFAGNHLRSQRVLTQTKGATERPKPGARKFGVEQ